MLSSFPKKTQRPDFAPLAEQQHSAGPDLLAQAVAILCARTGLDPRTAERTRCCAPAVADEALRLALNLARNCGYAVFPCLGSKAPVCHGGFRSASKDAAAIKELWRRWPGALVGIATGEVSGIDVLDIDSAKHPEAAAWWEISNPKVGPTRIYRTRSGGLHCYFRHANGVRSTTSKVSIGIDVRAEAGCIISWWCAGLDCVDDSPVADWPDWLLKLALPPSPQVIPTYTPPAPSGEAGRRYGEAALRRAVGAVSAAGEGTRNHTLNREAWGLFRLVPRHLSAGEIIEAMTAAAQAAGLTPDESLATIGSAMRRRIS